MKYIAYYLPQYHPTEYNDEWWGKGFTEWTNVVKSKPRFNGHHQPQLPADLGFYDLRLPEVREQQAELARQHGIYGFCYYHYWFSGQMLLDRPFNEVLESGSPDFPFCLCWANEKWTRAWEAHETEVLVRQEYSREDRINHINWLCEAFADQRYIRINNKPLLLIYRIDEVPDLKDRIDEWQRIAKEKGFEGLYICSVRNYSNISEADIQSMGINAIAEHQPNDDSYPQRGVSELLPLALSRVVNKTIDLLGCEKFIPYRNENRLFNYKKFVAKALSRSESEMLKRFPCVFPSWDNSARKRKAVVIQNDAPSEYQFWLDQCSAKVATNEIDERIVFINAWNEWAEGCHLEPDTVNGLSFLEATRNVERKYNKD